MKHKLIRETDVLRYVCEYLKERNYFFTRLNNVPPSARNGPFRSHNKYTLKGMPDVLILWKGIMICVEVKRPHLSEREPNGRTTRGGKLSMFQAEFAANVAINDGEFFCVRSVEELDRELLAMRQARNIEEAPAQSYGPVR